MIFAVATLAQAELVGDGYGAYLGRTLLVLIFVCALAWVVLRLFLRRFSVPGSRASAAQPAPLRVVARLTLEPRRAVYLIEAPGKTLLVGVSETGPMTTLAELDPTHVTTVTTPRQKSFLELLTKRRTSEPGSVASTPASSSEDARDGAL